MTPPITKALLQSIEKLLQEQGEKLDALLGLLLNGEVPFVEKKQGSEAKNVCHSCSLVFDDTTDVCSDCGATLVSIPILVTEFPVDDYAAVAPASSDPAPKQRRKRVTEITPEFWEDMFEEYGSVLGKSWVYNEISLAVAHKSHAKYDGKQQHVRNWLKKAVEYQAARAPASTPEQDLERHRAGYEQPRRMVGREDAPDKD